MRNDSVTIVRLPKTTTGTIQITTLTNVTLQSKRIVNVDKDGAHTADVLLLFCNPSEDIQVGDFVIPDLDPWLHEGANNLVIIKTAFIFNLDPWLHEGANQNI